MLYFERDRFRRADEAARVLTEGRELTDLDQRELSLLCRAYSESFGKNDQLKTAELLWKKAPESEDALRWMINSLNREYMFSDDNRPLLDFIDHSLEMNRGNKRKLLVLKARAIINQRQGLSDAQKRESAKQLLVESFKHPPPGAVKSGFLDSLDTPRFLDHHQPFCSFFSPEERAELKAQLTETQDGDMLPSIEFLRKRGVKIERVSGDGLHISFLNSEGVTDAELVHLENIRDVTSLILEGTQITDAGLAHVQHMESLETLWLRNCNISDEGIVHIRNLTNLKELMLGNTRVTDEGVAMLKDLTSLEFLELFGTGLSDKGLADVASLQRLKKLFIWNTKITESGLESISQALPDCYIAYEPLVSRLDRERQELLNRERQGPRPKILRWTRWLAWSAICAFLVIALLSRALLRTRQKNLGM